MRNPPFEPRSNNSHTYEDKKYTPNTDSIHIFSPIIHDNKLTKDEIHFLEDLLTGKTREINISIHQNLEDLKRMIFAELHSRIQRSKDKKSTQYIRHLLKRLEKFFQTKTIHESPHIVPEGRLRDYTGNTIDPTHTSYNSIKKHSNPTYYNYTGQQDAPQNRGEITVTPTNTTGYPDDAIRGLHQEGNNVSVDSVRYHENGSNNERYLNYQ